MLKGIAASSGVVVAKAYKLVQPVLNISRRSVDVEPELLKFEEALSKHEMIYRRLKKRQLVVYRMMIWRFSMPT